MGGWLTVKPREWLPAVNGYRLWLVNPEVNGYRRSTLGLLAGSAL